MGSDSPFLLAGVSLLSALHMGYLARRVGRSRMAHKVLPPSVTGPPEFERTFRAHQNCVEFYPLFLVTMWTCGMFCSEVVAAVGGLVYMIARQVYFNGYVKSSKKRLPGFYLTLVVFATLSLLAIIGILRGVLHEYFHIHL
ncbi:microsomal glutathione S-transferase 2 [Notolabrus celidotus]|uniref:microsomal glutathione S-transferase 2 n=1 Tax=Notolabrus celidotus TaxID=1203425 RepID=UPI00148FEFD5|nr:microsomal glutathione S-transferase 2 [Notolabrus celidotus]XP_034545542.1 microsomal glutathione S-transferase 2 [Notolabrus celidotus]